MNYLTGRNDESCPMLDYLDLRLLCVSPLQNQTWPSRTIQATCSSLIRSATRSLCPVEGIPLVIPLSRDRDPFIASVVGESVAYVFAELEKVILDDPGNCGVAQLFLKSDLLKATLALSHAN